MMVVVVLVGGTTAQTGGSCHYYGSDKQDLGSFAEKTPHSCSVGFFYML
jgi:hypothetical protein